MSQTGLQLLLGNVREILNEIWKLGDNNRGTLISVYHSVVARDAIPQVFTCHNNLGRTTSKSSGSIDIELQRIECPELLWIRLVTTKKQTVTAVLPYEVVPVFTFGDNDLMVTYPNSRVPHQLFFLKISKLHT